MSQPDSKNSSMKWMTIAMVTCCAIPIAIFLFLGGGLGFWAGRTTQQTTSNQSNLQPTNLSQSQPAAVKPSVSLASAGNWQANNHVHGLAVNSTNSQIIYVAIHNGLLQCSETGEWFWMGKQRADYMGFTADLTNPNRFYSSGHPPTGGTWDSK